MSTPPGWRTSLSVNCLFGFPRPSKFTCQASERHPNRKRFPDWRASVGLMTPDRRTTSLRLWTAPEGSSVNSSHGRRSNHDFLHRPSL